jgi:hypothetical protein
VTVAAEIERQRKSDEQRGLNVDLLSTRVGAVFDAADASVSGEEGGHESLRQSLIDLAACAEALAVELPPPLQWQEQNERRILKLAQRQRSRQKVPPPPPPPKRCSGCHKLKPAEEFGRNKANRDGLMYTCKACHRSRTERPAAERATAA